MQFSFIYRELFLEIFDKIQDDLAAVIVEPIAGNMGFVPGTKEFLEIIREKTSSVNSLLIFDEVMSGFRVSLGGAQEIYNIKLNGNFRFQIILILF